MILICNYVANALFNVTTTRFNEGFKPLFGTRNLVRSSDDKSVSLLLDRTTGSGFISTRVYIHGFFSATIKLPSSYTAGIVVAFYTSNGDVFKYNHDELDFEFLGNIEGKPWRFQTNLYGNGSTNRGREERYELRFDPTKEFHQYSILWTTHNIILDEVPIREVVRNEAMGGDYPSKPMSIYFTIWDGSNWATSNGQYKVNYKYAPFVSQCKYLVLEGCPSKPIQKVLEASDCNELRLDFSTVTPERRAAMLNFSKQYMHYSYCYDTTRYPVPLPECSTYPGQGTTTFQGHWKVDDWRQPPRPLTATQ